MRHFAALAVLAAALPGTAHAGSLTLGDNLVSRADCVAASSTDVSMSWDLGSITADHIVILASTSSGCADTTTTGITTNALVDDLSNSQTSYPVSGDSAITVQDVIGATGVDVGACGGDDKAVYICVRAVDSSGDTVAKASAKFTIQTEVPPPPVISGVNVGESALWVTWSAGTAVSGAAADSKTYKVFASANGTTVESAETTSTTLRLAGLTNLQTYDLWVVAYSSAGNASADSETSAGTPQHVVDFWEAYQAAGGQETGGCGQGSAGELSALAAIGWLAARRRRLTGARADGP
jgi:hypothetical protein